MYSAFKDFAGPLATLAAAVAAIVVTIFFNRSQLRIAASQRDIARDKLKSDLFKSRYEIYESAKALIEYVSLVHNLEQIDATKIRNIYVQLDEARFYYPEIICKYLNDLHDQCEIFFSHLSERDRTNLDNHEEWSRLADALARDQSELRDIYVSLPSTFESSLRFTQLTSS
jgi:hypothetical protein